MIKSLFDAHKSSEAKKSTTEIKLDEYESAPKDQAEDEDLLIPVFNHVSDDEEDGGEGSDLEMV